MPTKHLPISRTSAVIAALLILPCLYAAWLALQWGIADRYAYAAKQIEETWGGNREFDQEAHSEATNLAEKAVAWAPDHPEYRDQLGRLLTLQYVLDRDPATAATAKAHLLHSRGVRPEWGDNWAAYINLKHILNEADEELSAAIEVAAKVGPWEPPVIQAITRAGAAHYSALSSNAKQALHASILRGLQSPVRHLPGRTVSIMVEEVNGWTLELVNSGTTDLIESTWADRSGAAYVRLTFAWWPILNNAQRTALAVKAAAVVRQPRGNRLLRNADPSVARYLCPHLPREKRFQRFCNT